jgi:peptidoglycan/LPS O-acetylase OafA/YrhL
MTLRVESPPAIPSLTGLRFVAAASVVMAHAVHKFLPISGNAPPLYTLIASLSAIGMPLFFVLSGFVIHYNYSQRIEEDLTRGTLNFLVARFARLYPLYIVGIAFDLLNSYSYYQLNPHALEAIPYYLTMTQAWVYRVFGDTSLIYVFGHIPTVAWSISTEWFFYLAYPFLCLSIAKVRRVPTLAFVTSAFVLVALGLIAVANFNRAWIASAGVEAYGPTAGDIQHSYYRWLIYFSPYSRIMEFILGCLTASIFMKLRLRVPDAREQKRGLLPLIGALAGTAILYVIMFGLPAHPLLGWAQFIRQFHMSFGIAPCLALLIFCCARYQNAIVDLFSGRWIVLCGEASYSLYLLHLVVIDRLGIQSPAPSNPRIALGCFLRLGFCFLTCVGLSLVTWRLIEVPARRWLRASLSVAPRHSQEIGKSSVVS